MNGAYEKLASITMTTVKAPASDCVYGSSMTSMMIERPTFRGVMVGVVVTAVLVVVVRQWQHCMAA